MLKPQRIQYNIYSRLRIVSKFIRLLKSCSGRNRRIVSAFLINIYNALEVVQLLFLFQAYTERRVMNIVIVIVWATTVCHALSIAPADVVALARTVIVVLVTATTTIGTRKLL